MKHIEARIKTAFGEIVIQGENPKEVLEMLENMPENFLEKLSDFVSNKLTPSGAQLKGIVELTTEGPVIVAREKLTHYEAVGLTLYASPDKTNTAAQITKLLVFKPDTNKPEFKLTIQGEKWVEDEVLSKLRGKMG
jgi:hypothetical protein